LIEEEWQRAGKPAAGTGKKSRKKPPPEAIGFHAKRKNLVSAKNGNGNGNGKGPQA
jgi:hypothetical protein